MPENATPPESPTAALYGAAYYAAHCGIPYERNDHWLAFFGGVADHIVRDIAPQSCFDVGCAMGFLVEALVDRGVDAYGIDISDYAISQVRADVRERCSVGSAAAPFGRRFDLITCVEVIEHMSPADGEAVIANICDHTDDVIFASTPVDFREETHVNVNPPEHWAELFARFGFHRDVTYDVGYLAPWAMRFRRRRDPLPRMVREYERELWLRRTEAQQRNEVVVEQYQQLQELKASQELAQSGRLQAEVSRLRAELHAQRDLLAESTALARAQADELRNLHSSGAGHAVRIVQRGLTRLAPPGTRRQRSLHKAVRAGILLSSEGPSALRRAVRERNRNLTGGRARDIQQEYDEWRRRHQPSWADLNQMRNLSRTWSVRPLISVLMPTYNPDPDWLRPAIQSVIAQSYENWELCIADDASTQPHVAEILAQYAEAIPRIKLVMRSSNGGIAAASASALEVATGDFIALLDHDDVLRPHALHSVVATLHANPKMDVVYSDEDLLLEDGTYGRPFFKPDFSPDMLLSVNYICHLLVIRRSLALECGGFRGGFDGAQDHDLVLRATERARMVGHIPDILYSWRQVPGSVAMASEAKMYAYESGKKAVEEALQRRGQSGTVTLGQQLGTYHVRLEVLDQPHVAIIIPTRDRLSLLRSCIESIESMSSYPNWSITIIDNGSCEPETLAYLERSAHRVVRHPGAFNYSAIINAGRAAVDAPYILTVNNDTTVLTPDWIEAMLEQAQRPEVGVVGGRLLYPDGRPQHEGIAVGNVRGGYMAANLDAGWMGRIIRDVTAVSGACQMIRTAVFDEVGGYDEEIEVAYNDVDFCLRVRAAGYLVVYTPHAELRHHESASRGGLDPLSDHHLFWSRWGAPGGIHDPYMSPHLRDLNPLRIRLDPLPIER